MDRVCGLQHDFLQSAVDPMTMDFSLLRDFGVALLIGVLVGVDREQRKNDPGFGGVGGLRTFILLAEAGALAGWLSDRLASPGVLMAAAAMATSILLAGYWWHARTMTGTPGVTTLVGGLVVFFLGALVLLGAARLAVALAIVTSAVLAYKEPLHRVVNRIGREDLYAGIKLLAATFIVLPVVPDRVIDPWGALNPYKIWLLVVLISGLSLVGYVITRLLGSGKGTPLTGLAGGLVSSTVVSLEFARRSRREEGDADALAAGILLAWTVMVGRVVVIVGAVYRPLLWDVLPGMVLLGLATGGVAVWWWRRASAAEGESRSDRLPVKNPFNLTSAIQFAVLFAVVLLLVKVFEAGSSGGGVYAVAVLAGLTDVDAITLSMAELVKSGGESVMAVRAVILAALANTVFKAAVVAGLGSRELRRRVVLSGAVVGAAAVLALMV